MDEEVARRKGDAARSRRRDDLDALQRIAAELEEVVVDTNRPHVERVAPELGQQHFDRRARRDDAARTR